MLTETGAAKTHPLSLYTLQELADLPPPPWLIEGVLELGANSMMFGAAASGKTFIAVDMAMSVATGNPWQGRPVRQGVVVYVAGESFRGVARRAEAWRRHYRVEVEGFYLVRQGAQLHKAEDRQALKGQIDRLNLKPSLIVVDTLAKCFVGGDENDAAEAGQFLAGVQEVIDTYGATALVLHHTNKPRDGQTQERGSSAWRSNVDVVMRVDRTTEDQIILSNLKQKEAEEFDDIPLRLEETPAVEGRTSCIVLPGKEGTNQGISKDVGKALLAFQACGTPQVSPAEWRTQLTTMFEVSASTFYRYRNAVVGRYVEQGEDENYVLTEQGTLTLSMLS